MRLENEFCVTFYGFEKEILREREEIFDGVGERERERGNWERERDEKMWLLFSYLLSITQENKKKINAFWLEIKKSDLRDD